MPMTQLWQKAYCFFSFSFFSIFRAQRFLLAFMNNIDNQGARAPLNSIFANQFKCITREKLRVFVLKFAIPGPHLTFSWT